MQWSVIHEAGIRYAPSAGTHSEQSLAFPAFAQRSPDGSYLIVDELDLEKILPFRFECRTIHVDADHRLLYDTRADGIDDGYGCLMDGGRIAVLRRTKWELLVISRQGKRLQRLGLETFSKRTPRLLAWTPAGTFLLALLDAAGQCDLVEIDRQGRLLWYLPPGVLPIGVPGSIQLAPNGTLLVADPFHHVVLEFDRQGKVLWRFGRSGEPSGRSGHLSSPGSVRRLPGGGHLVADTRNHRVLLVGADGASTPVRAATSDFCDPACAERLPDGHTLVCDTGNRRVVELDQRGGIVWQHGRQVRQQRFLSYPRSVELTGDGGYLVADTAHDRIVQLGPDQVTEKPFQGRPALFWPRCVRLLPGGALLIADGRNRRIVQVSAAGTVTHELAEVNLDGPAPLEDPHDVWLLANGHLLICDSPRDLVAEVDWSGRVYRVIGRGDQVRLDDPHSAQQLADGRIVIADTGNHRVLVVGPESDAAQDIRALAGDSSWVRLHRPRYVEAIPDGTMVIVDTGNNRVLAATPAAGLLWELARVPGSPLPRLNQPRWAKLIDRHEVVVCDHYHHRIVRLRRGMGL